MQLRSSKSVIDNLPYRDRNFLHLHFRFKRLSQKVAGVAASPGKRQDRPIMAIGIDGEGRLPGASSPPESER